MADPADLAGYGGRQRRDASGRLIPYDEGYLFAPDYQGPLTTPGDIKRAQDAATLEYGVNAGIGAVGLAGQEALSFADTAQDTKNKQALGSLEKLEKAGKLGLTGEERATYERGLLNPVKAIAGDANRLQEARLAAGGGGHDAATVVRAERESARRLDQAGIDAAQKIEGAHLARKSEQRQEMEQRRSYESGRETQRLNLLSETIPGLMSNIGKAAAGIALPASMTDSQLLQMQSARDANGQLLYPGMKGKDVTTLRAMTAGSGWEANARTGLQGGNVASGGAGAAFRRDLGEQP